MHSYSMEISGVTVHVTVERIDQWNSDNLPIFEVGIGWADAEGVIVTWKQGILTKTVYIKSNVLNICLIGS